MPYHGRARSRIQGTRGKAGVATVLCLVQSVRNLSKGGPRTENLKGVRRLRGDRGEAIE